MSDQLQADEQRRADKARFAGRPVQFLSDGRGQYGTVVDAWRMCRAGTDEVCNVKLLVRMSQVGRIGFARGSDPGSCVEATLDDVKFID